MTSLLDLDQLNPEQLRALAEQLLQRVSTLDDWPPAGDPSKLRLT